jgi:hypothetical protein
MQDFRPQAIGGGTPSIGTAVAVPGTAVLLAAANTNRQGLAFYNPGPATVYVASGTAAGTANGWPIPGTAGWPTYPAPLGVGPWYGIAASGTVSVRVLELG